MKTIDIVKDFNIYKGELKITLPRIMDIRMIDGDYTNNTIQKIVDHFPDKISLYDGIPVLRETNEHILMRYVKENTFPHDCMVGRLVKVSDRHADVIFTDEYSPVIRKSIESGNFDRLRISFVMTTDDYRNESPNILAVLLDTHTQYQIMVKESDRMMLEETRPSRKLAGNWTLDSEKECSKEKAKERCTEECVDKQSEDPTYFVYFITGKLEHTDTVAPYPYIICSKVAISDTKMVEKPFFRAIIVVSASNPTKAVIKGYNLFSMLRGCRPLNTVDIDMQVFYYDEETRYLKEMNLGGKEE